MGDGKGDNRRPMGCGVLFLLFALYLFWPLILMVTSSLFYSLRDVWPNIRIPLTILVLGGAIWFFIRWLTYRSRMSYESIQKLVWETGARYARQKGVRPTAARTRHYEAPGYTVSDFIDRYGISRQMDRELLREYKRAFR